MRTVVDFDVYMGRADSNAPIAVVVVCGFVIHFTDSNQGHEPLRNSAFPDQN